MERPNSAILAAIDKALNFSQNSYEIFKSSQIEEKRRILNIVFANFFMEGKNPVILMRKNFNLLSNLGGCQVWCTKVDELLNSIVDETRVINSNNKNVTILALNDKFVIFS